MRKFEGIFLIVLLAHLGASQNDVDDCIMPNKQESICVQLKLCPTILKAINNSSHLFDRINGHLDMYRCKKNDVQELYCCPDFVKNYTDDFERLSTPPKPRVTTTPPPRREVKPVETFMDELRRHRNFALLNPENCGKNSDRFVDLSPEFVYIPDKYPWVALLGYEGRDNQITYKCAGSLINEQYVLTSAFCLKHFEKDHILHHIRLGEFDLSKDKDCYFENNADCLPPHQDIGYDSFVVHGNYNDDTKDYDVGLLRLDRAVNFTRSVNTICLPLDEEYLMAMLPEGIVSGWKLNFPNNQQKNLPKESTLSLLPSPECQTIFNNANIKYSGNKLCARKNGDSQVYSGDLGTPLVFNMTAGKFGDRYVQFGIESTNRESIDFRSPSVFTNVPNHLYWILENITP